MRRLLSMHFVTLATSGLLVAMMSVTAYAEAGNPGRTSPYAIPSRCEPLAGELAGSLCEGETEAVCVTLPACWWRDTTAQNAVTESAETQFLGEAVAAYQSASISVWVYSSREGPNVIVLVAGTQYLLVGAGASDNVRDAAQAAFAAAIPGFADMTLAGIFYPSAERGMAGSAWTSTPGVPVYVNVTWATENHLRTAVAAALNGLLAQVSGSGLIWGADGALGAGVAYLWDLAAPTSINAPNSPLSNSTTTNLSLNGVPMWLPPSYSDENHYLYVPQPRVLILGRPFGPYFPDVAPLDGKPLHLYFVVRWLNNCISHNANVLVLQHGTPIVGSANVAAALTAWRDALDYVQTETRRRMNAGEDVDTIATTLTLQEPLASSPWVQPLTTTVEAAVRATYAAYLGPYGGRPATLAGGGLTPTAEAARLVATAGGPAATLARAREALTEHTPEGTRWAVRLADAVIQADPPEALVTAAYCLYSAAVRQVALSARSATARNLLLTEAAAVDLGEACATDTDADGTPDWLDPDHVPCLDEEVCDGVDNDCDGQTDEGLPEHPPECDDGNACNGAETCQAGLCAPGEPLPRSGDVDGNETLSSGDAALVFQIALGAVQPTAAEACAADCNGDGVISSGDAMQIFEAALGGGTCIDGLRR